MVLMFKCRKEKKKLHYSLYLVYHVKSDTVTGINMEKVRVYSVKDDYIFPQGHVYLGDRWYRSRSLFGRYTHIHTLIRKYMNVHTHTHEILLGSRRKIKRGMGKENYTEMLFFYRKIRVGPPVRLLKQSPKWSDGVSQGGL